MIKKSQKQESEVRTAMRGGEGEVMIRHFFKKDEMHARCRLCARMILPPGASIGLHEHKEEDEVYIIEQGAGMLSDDGTEKSVTTGDAILTGNGASHSIRNSGNTDLVITAVIMHY